MTDEIDQEEQMRKQELDGMREVFAALGAAVAGLGDVPRTLRRGRALLFVETGMLWLETDLLELERRAMGG